MSNNIIVAIKVRPLIKREKTAKLEEQWKVTGNSIQCTDVLHPNVFQFGTIEQTSGVCYIPLIFHKSNRSHF